jgi:NADPH2:quinone reductase
MRAAMLHEYGPPENLVVEEVPDPSPKPHQLVVDVHACGVNFPDVLMVQDLYQFKPALPFAPGGEISGTVAAVGADVTDWAVGDLVAAGTGTGGFAEQVVVDASKAYRIPAGVDLTAAAGFLTTYGTSYHALRDRANLQPGETLLVLGAAGGVGLSAVELGASMGAKVIAAASSEEKLAVCRQYGAAETVNYAEVDLKAWLKEHTGGKGVDVVYDPVGGDLAEPALRSTGWKGRYLVIGFAGGIPRVPLNLPLLKGCSIVGAFLGGFMQAEPDAARANQAQLLKWLGEGKIKPHVSAKYPLDRGIEALREVQERRARGKVLITPEEKT